MEEWLDLTYKCFSRYKFVCFDLVRRLFQHCRQAWIDHLELSDDMQENTTLPKGKKNLKQYWEISWNWQGAWRTRFRKRIGTRLGTTWTSEQYPWIHELQLLLLTLHHSAQDSNNKESRVVQVWVTCPFLGPYPAIESKNQGSFLGESKVLDLPPLPCRTPGLH